MENQAKTRLLSLRTRQLQTDMYTDQKPEVPPELELFLAHELAIALVAKHVGFTLEEFDVEWYGDGGKPRALSSVSGIQLLTVDAPEQRRAYIEKRIAVLCARAYATMLILTRKANANETAVSGDEFWHSLRDIGDHSLVVELCAAYLIEDTSKPDSGGEEIDFVERQNQYIFYHGLQTVATLLTGTEFLSFVEKSLSNFDRSMGMFQTTISAEVLKSYEPGTSTLKIGEGARPAAELRDQATDLTFPQWSRSEENVEVSRRCLVAHELGHWMSAQYVGIPTSGVQFKLDELLGSCEVFLGPPAFQWTLERYLSARIAVLCAGSYAECLLRTPDEGRSFYDALFSTLYFGTGKDDFSKLQELYLIYRTMPQSLAVPRNMASRPGREEIWSVLTDLLQKFGLYDALKSPEFEELVNHIFSRAKSSSSTPTNFETAELDAACSAHGLCRGVQ